MDAGLMRACPRSPRRADSQGGGVDMQIYNEKRRKFGGGQQVSGGASSSASAPTRFAPFPPTGTSL